MIRIMIIGKGKGVQTDLHRYKTTSLILRHCRCQTFLTCRTPQPFRLNLITNSIHRQRLMVAQIWILQTHHVPPILPRPQSRKPSLPLLLASILPRCMRRLVAVHYHYPQQYQHRHCKLTLLKWLPPAILLPPVKVEAARRNLWIALSLDVGVRSSLGVIYSDINECILVKSHLAVHFPTVISVFRDVITWPKWVARVGSCFTLLVLLPLNFFFSIILHICMRLIHLAVCRLELLHLLPIPPEIISRPQGPSRTIITRHRSPAYQSLHHHCHHHFHYRHRLWVGEEKK